MLIAPAPAPVQYEPVQERGPFIPPAPEAPVRPVRMPSIEDLPRPGQEQLRAWREGDRQAEQPAPVARRQTLFERLAAFGMSRQEEAEQQAAPRAAAPQPRQPQPAPRPAYQPKPVHDEYGKRAPAPQAHLDQHGRVAPAPRTAEDDHLEIPAFLRRQSS